MVKKRVLFMCIHNAARSQMAEGLFRHFYGDGFDVYSAGSEPQGVDPLAIKCMDEIGIDISNHRSKSLKEFEGQNFDYVITVCGNSYNACPFFVGGIKYFKQAFEDPSSFEGNEKEKLELFNKVRDELSFWLNDLYYSYLLPDDERVVEEDKDVCCGSIDREFSCR
ncbi:protein tyrosine phosphatase [Methanobacterium lacus]|uniref:Protein tyrosine phosphatase n=1 Tax=Methanobacterium lacus (strain AL-21) TaxID=877455 RepID=F0TAK9_METLA|nr:arsenate reductase ArsC [Methanobacterium lacus]ADZ10081.1 protein tyrosine phosphatase [Methanobacterium lacus]